MATLFLAINYYMTTKYNTKFVYNAFFGILVARPALIILYSIAAILIEMVRRQSKTAKPWKKKSSKVSDSGPSDISESQEASDGDESESADNEEDESQVQDDFYDDSLIEDMKPTYNPTAIGHLPTSQQLH